MPSERTRSKEDTWTPEELKNSLKGSKKNPYEKSKGRDRDRDQRRREDRSSHAADSTEDRYERRRDETNGTSRRSERAREDDEDERMRLREDRRRRREGGTKDGRLNEDRKEPRRQRDDGSDERPEKTRTEDDRSHRRRKEEDSRQMEEQVPRDYRELHELQREEIYLTEEDRERQRRERREKREKKDGSMTRKTENEDFTERKRNPEDAERRRGKERDDRHRDENYDNERDRRRDKGRDDRRRDRDGDDRRQNEESERQRDREERRTRPEDDDRKSKDDRRDKDRRKDDHRNSDQRDGVREERKERERRKDDHHNRDQRDGVREERKERERKDREKEENREREKEENRERERKDRKKEERREEERRNVEREKDERSSKGHRSSDKHTSKEVEQKPSVQESKPSDDYNYDDDEFEDYEEDFEEDEDESQDEEEKRRSRDEMEDVLRALDEENDRLMATSRRSDHSDSTELSDERFQNEQQPMIARSRTIINFVSAKQRQLSDKASSKTRRRGNDLLKLIDLDTSGFDIFDLPPVGEYDLYIRSFGRSNTRQTNEDNIERDIQTEEIEYRDRWTQHPPEDFNGCGRGDDAFDETEEDASRRKYQTDTVRLSRFLQKAAQVVAILLDEELQSNSKGEITGSRSSLSISDGYVTLGSPEFLKGRHVQCSHFSPDQPNLLLTIHSQPEKIDKKNPLSRTGLICMWNSNEPSIPQKILACESQPLCCCFSPIKPSLVFAGTADGSVIAWDLQESTSMHKAVKVADQEYIPRFPTYNTAGVSSDETHFSSVTSIVPIISQKERVKANTVMNDSGSSLSFQLASLEESGILHIWVVAEINSPDLSGSESDLGLSPGGKIKLLKSSSITIDTPLRNFQVKAPIKAVDMVLLPDDPNQFFVGTDLGIVIHGVRLGTVSYPKCYTTETGSPVSVMSVDISPFTDPCLLVGCDDGSVRLHNLKLEYPPMIWPRVCDNGSVTCVRWSRSRPCVFFILDDTSRIHVFDLIERDSSPVAVETVSAGRILSMELTNDHTATGLGLPGRQPQILLSMDSGDTEIHTLTKQFTEQQTLEDEFIQSYIERF